MNIESGLDLQALLLKSNNTLMLCINMDMDSYVCTWFHLV